MVSLNEPGGLLGELLPRPTSMTHSMVTSQSTCQAAAQAYNSQTARDVGVSTLKSAVGGSNREVIFCIQTGRQAPLSVVSIPCTLALGTQGVAPNSLFMCRYPSKACGILLSNSKSFLCVVFKERSSTQVKTLVYWLHTSQEQCKHFWHIQIYKASM